MKCNIGKTDRAVRIAIGLAIIAAGIYFNELWGIIGLMPLATGLIRWCPAYVPFGITTEGK